MRTLRLFPYGTCGETLPGRYSFHLPQNLGDWAESIDEGQSIQPSFLAYKRFRSRRHSASPRHLNLSSSRYNHYDSNER
jgi:hypothetical protein